MAAALTALVVTAAGYAVFANRAGRWPFSSTPATPTTESPGPTTEPGTGEQPPTVSAVGTGTYANKEFGFSFVIPAPLVGLESRYPDTVYLNIGTEKEISEIRNLEGAGYRDFLSLFAFRGTPSAEGCADYRSTTPITIAGVSGIKCTGLESAGTVDNETVLFRFFSPTEPNIVFQITSDQYTGANIATIDQILATLKFTVPEWKTYTNVQLGYSYQYPPSWNAFTYQYNPYLSLFGPDATATAGAGGVEMVAYPGTIEEYIAGIDATLISSSAAKIDGIPAVRARFQSHVGPMTAYYLKKDGTIVSIYLHSGDPAQIELLDRLVATFTLTK